MNPNKRRLRWRGDVNHANIKKKKNCGVWIDLIQLPRKADDSTSGYEWLVSDTPYTIGRSNRVAHLVFNDPRVSKQHCQILFDSLLKKLYLFNGVFSASSGCCIVDHFRDKLIGNENDSNKDLKHDFCCGCTYDFRPSLNGVFVNGVKLSAGVAVELCVGFVVMLVCANLNCTYGGLESSIGFMVRSFVFHDDDEEFLVNKRVFTSGFRGLGEVVGREKALLACCNQILSSDDPVSCIRQCIASCLSVDRSYYSVVEGKKSLGFEPSSNTKSMSMTVENVAVGKQQPFEAVDVNDSRGLRASEVRITTNAVDVSENMVSSVLEACTSYPNGCTNAGFSNKIAYSSEQICVDEMDHVPCGAMRQTECQVKVPPPPGKNFYLNGLKGMHQGSSGHQIVVSLPELLHPVDSISRMFIATFTSDIEWFLSYCDIPSHLPVTVACHNTERCWSGDCSKRSCEPYPNFPNLVVLYPPFPEAIAFGKDRKNRGVGCHHPKFFVLQREDSMRVIITSANLVAKQWQSVTNTIWWQDFPFRQSPDCTPLFNQLNGSMKKDMRSDFAAQLAGFMATLVTDVPSEAHWIVELTKYDFGGANGYLVASVPGIHSYKSLSETSPACKFNCSELLLGTVEACVVGLSYLFRASVDSNGLQLKKLAAYLGKSAEKGCRMSEILLRREKNVSSDSNAVSVVVPNHADISEGDCVQLGFLPRAVAKWVSPLWDMGFFRFCGHLCPMEALAAAFGENNLKVQLILHVSQGPNFVDIPKRMEPKLAVAFCSLVASLQRCTGLWRMEEVLHQYKWPESLESDFIYGSSSIGTSVSAQFLAAFSAAAGKRSQDVYDSEESDPEWGHWTAAHELKHPSIRIIFPTIDRVKSSHCGIVPSKHLLCFSEKTWQRLNMANTLYDAVPQPSERLGYPMHIKVARRCFKSKTNGSSFGWIYCGSHNMSAAAWGRPISSQSGGLVSGRSVDQSSCSRLHVCNYELGIIFVFPPPEIKGSGPDNSSTLDDISLPFVEPAPRYGPRDRPATKRAMSEALAELAKEGRVYDLAAVEEAVEEVPDEDDEVEVVSCVVHEEEEEKAYADLLWHQVDSSQSC